MKTALQLSDISVKEFHSSLTSQLSEPQNEEAERSSFKSILGKIVEGGSVRLSCGIADSAHPILLK